MRKTGHLIAPIAVAIGLVLLMFDAEAGLHNPLRFFYLLSNVSSVMMWGVVFLSLFMVVSIVTVVLDFMKRPVPNWLAIIGVALGACVGAYTGALLGVCQTFPLWNNQEVYGVRPRRADHEHLLPRRRMVHRRDEDQGQRRPRIPLLAAQEQVHLREPTTCPSSRRSTMRPISAR